MTSPILRAHWIRAGAVATLLLSAGILTGTYLAPSAPAVPLVPAAGPPQAGGPSPAPGPSAPGSPLAATPTQPHVPAAPGFEPFDAEVPRPEFGGQYAVLRGASTVSGDGGPPPSAALGEAPPAASSFPAQSLPAAPSEPVTGDPPRSEPAPGDPGERLPRSRPGPAQGMPRGIALQQPLLAIVRTGGRTVFHDLSTGRGPTPAGLEGEWSVIGRCEWSARVDLGMPARQVGDLRGVGRTDPGSAWSGEPVVPRQACAAAGERFTRPRAASDADRDGYAQAGGPLGFTAGDLAQVAEVRGGVVLVFGGTTGSAVVAGVRSARGAEVHWTYTAQPGDGDLTLVGVYRTGTEVQAWVLLGPRGSPGALMIVSSSDLRTWSPRGPFPLNQP